MFHVNTLTLTLTLLIAAVQTVYLFKDLWLSPLTVPDPRERQLPTEPLAWLFCEDHLPIAHRLETVKRVNEKASKVINNTLPWVQAEPFKTFFLDFLIIMHLPSAIYK